MNFVFISPNFPDNYWLFCQGLKRLGVNVCGIGDAPYETLSEELKQNLNEYYRVDSLADYDEMIKAIGQITLRYGKIQWLESNK